MKLKQTIDNSKGQVLILTVVAIFALVGLSALAIDLGMAYAVKAKLTSAVDAASLAAGKAIKTGADDATRKQNALAAANSYFAANFPTNYMGSSSTSFSVDKIVNDAGTWTVNVSASSAAPIFFSKVINAPITASASAETTVRSIDMMLVLDCSGSLGSSFSALQQAAILFINGFQEGAGGDRVGLVTFASGAVLNDAINKDANRGFTRLDLIAHINSAASNGATNAEEAMRIAKAEMDAIPSGIRSTLRVIVLFSDGAPNIVSGNFVNSGTTRTGGLWSQGSSPAQPTDLYTINKVTSSGDPKTYSSILKLPTQDYTGTVNLASFNNARTLTSSGTPATVNNTGCNVNKAARNMVENIANSARSGAGNSAITIYSIGLGSQLKSNEVTSCSYGSQEYGENIMKRLANTTDSDKYQSAQPSGMYVYAADATQLNSAFQKVRSLILRLSK